MRRRDVLAALPLLGGVPYLLDAAAAAETGDASSAPRKVLRYAFPAAETGFDPAKISDLYSRTCTAHIFESLYRFDYLARSPSKVVPHIAEAMPRIDDDFRTWTIRIRAGIHFADDAAFRGVPRELVAEDFVYSWKRLIDPAHNGPSASGFLEEGVLGMAALRDEAAKPGKKFDYDREVEGLRAIDRYTLQFRLAAPRPRLHFTLADSSLIGAVAREVVEFYGDAITEHPVGTGPFKLGTWRRSSFIAFDRNPTYRDVRYDGEPAPDDALGQALLQRFRGTKLPMVDRIEVSIIEESQPRWLSFLNGQIDVLAVPLEFAQQAVPGGKLASWLVKRGVRMDRFANADRTLYYFNMEDPTVGGMAPEKVALRRAISLATDVGVEIRQVRRGQAIPAQSTVSPGGFGYDPAYRSENGVYDLARSKALLDIFGYVDRNGDSWRDNPDGSPLVIDYATTPDAISRQFDELWKKNMDAVGIRLRFVTAQWPEQLKAARAGKLMVWQLGYSSSSPDFQDGLQTLYGPAAGGQNLPRFNDARFDELYRRMQALPDGPERLALLREVQKRVTAYAPVHYNVHRIVTWLTQPRVQGFRAPMYGNQFWQYVGVDDSPTPSSSTT